MSKTIIPDSREHWLSLRQQDITSTEVSALFGASKYATRFELWHQKQGQIPAPFSENERTKWGSALQASIAAQIATDRRWSIRAMPEYMRDESIRAGSSFDFRVLVSADGTDSADDALLEIKNVDRLVFRDDWIEHDDGSIEAPPHIEFQVQHQLMLSGLSRAYIAALVGGNTCVIAERKRNEAVIDAIRREVADFWASIEAKREPAPEYPQDAEAVLALNQHAEPGTVVDVSALTDLAAKYREASEQIKAYNAVRDELKARMIEAMGPAETGIGQGFKIKAGVVGPTLVPAYERKGYRTFRVYWSKGGA